MPRANNGGWKTHFPLQFSLQGERFGGTCLYAHVNGSWGAYEVKPSESGSIQNAEAWLVKKEWCGWV